MSETETTSIGQTLKHRREELGLSLGDMVERTRIRGSYLEALEEERYDELPGATYISGFLRTYARVLKLDPEPLMQELHRRIPHPQGGGEKISTHGYPPPFPVGGGRRGLPLPVWIGLGLLVLGGLYLAFATSEEPPVPVQAESTAPPAEPAPDVPIAAGPGLEEGQVTPPPAESSAAVLLPEGGGVLRLEAQGASRLELELDGFPVRVYDLTSDSALSWDVKRGAALKVDDPAAVRVWLGEEEISLGEGGELNLSYPQESEPGEDSQ